jgi:ABC-type transport system involved in cytochrome c biogenesis permease subunit
MLSRTWVGDILFNLADNRPAIPLWLFVLASCSITVALYLIFVWVSTEATMGIVQRIFYFHVPAAAVSFTAAFVGGIASILYLTNRDSKYDDLSLAANESVILFGIVNVVMGSMWAIRVWGIWWTWDAKLTSQFICYSSMVPIFWFGVPRRQNNGESCAPSFVSWG